MHDSFDFIYGGIILSIVVFSAIFLLSLGFFVLQYVSDGCIEYVCRIGTVALCSALAGISVVILAVKLDNTSRP